MLMTEIAGQPTLQNALVLLIVVATAVSFVTRRIGVPFTVGLVLAGLALGSLHIISPLHLTKELVFAVFLPGLVFEAAFRLRYADVRRNGTAIIALAMPGVGIALALTAGLLVAASSVLGLSNGFTWRQGLVFGALIAATDPIAVVALFRSLKAPKRLTVLVEAESLVNDGTAIVFFGIILSATAGAEIHIAALGAEFVRVVGIGAVVGLVVSWLVTHVTRNIDDPVVEITLTVIAAYGSFALADQLGGSGVIATVLAGLVVGNYGAKVGMAADTLRAVESFWDYVAFLLNSIVFLLIGFEIRFGALLASTLLILVAFIAVLVARAAVVGSVTAALSRSKDPIPSAWLAPLTWGGLRGALSMVLALSLPGDFPGRERIVTVTFGVVLLSILLQGITMAPLLRRGRLVGVTPDA